MTEGNEHPIVDPNQSQREAVRRGIAQFQQRLQAAGHDPRVRTTTSPGIVQSVRHQSPDFSPTPSCRTADKKSGGSETKRGLRRFSGVGGHGVSQEPIAKSPAYCGALSA